MSRHVVWLAFLAVGWVLSSITFASEKVPAITKADRACTASETWSFSQAIPQQWARALSNGALNRERPVMIFAQALALRRVAASPEEKLLAEYWISRSLLEAKLVHIAWGGMSAIVQSPPMATTRGVREAALQCLLSLQETFPSLTMPSTLRASRLALTAEGPSLWRGALLRLQTELSSQDFDIGEAHALVALLRGGGPYEALGKGLLALQTRKPGIAKTELTAFVNTSRLPGDLRRYLNTVRLLLAHAHFSLREHDLAVAQIQNIDRNANILSEALVVQAWAQLKADRHKDSIGSAMSLASGGLRRAFAPEAPMIQAMALNELCQFPQSLQAIERFRNEYLSVYKWLRDSAHGALYPKAVAFLKKRPVQVPERVLSEWVRSPLFLSNQGELNLLFDETESSAGVARSGAQEQRRIAREVLTQARDLKLRVRVAKMKLKRGEPLPGRILADLDLLKERIIRMRRLKQAAPVWKGVLASFQKMQSIRKSRLVREIEADFTARDRRMLAQLDEVSENLQLIEVEIFHGASQDLVWRNAHPDYAKVADSLGRESGGKVGTDWNWGRAPSSDDAQAEVWEDEVGSFQADLVDHCSSKDRYLALRRLRLSEGREL